VEEIVHRALTRDSGNQRSAHEIGFTSLIISSDDERKGGSPFVSFAQACFKIKELKQTV
jgi:hypothetical protein